MMIRIVRGDGHTDTCPPEKGAQEMATTVKVLFVMLVLAVSADAEIIGAALGPDAPPEQLGGYTMLAFPPDDRPLFTDVPYVTGPTGDILLEPACSHRRVGDGWATWSHGYLGDIYFPNSAPSVTITLPADTGAFIVYAEPGPFAWHTMAATANDGTMVSQLVHGDSGAAGFGFWLTGDSELTSVTIEVYDPVSMAVGEFLIAEIPEPTTLGLLLVAGVCLPRRRRRET